MASTTTHVMGTFFLFEMDVLRVGIVGVKDGIDFFAREGMRQ